MIRKNTMSPVSFLFNLVWWTIVSMVWYKNSLFRIAFNFTYAESKVLFWCIIFASLAIWGVLCWDRQRNWLSVCVGVLLPFEIYAVVTFYDVYPVRIIILLSIAVVMSLIIIVQTLTRRIKNGGRRREIIRARIKHCFCCTGTIVAFCLSLLLIPLGVKYVLGFPTFQSSVEPAVEFESEANTIRSNFDTVVKLEEETWETLSMQERLDVLQTVANIEKNYLKFPWEVTVEAGCLEEDVLGKYISNERKIVISIDCLMSEPASEMLKTICHECYHAHEHAAIDAWEQMDEESQQLYAFWRIREYKRDFENYADGSGDFLDYYMQQVERDSRDYSESAVDDYYSKIEEYKYNKGDNET